MMGDFRQDIHGNLIFPKNKNRELVDKIGRRVNQKGFLIDHHGNIIDKKAIKRFDKQQLNKDGNLPSLFNYEGRKLYI
jgi:hypothetical protein